MGRSQRFCAEGASASGGESSIAHKIVERRFDQKFSRRDSCGGILRRPLKSLEIVNKEESSRELNAKIILRNYWN
jgi:hypothetical protein